MTSVIKCASALLAMDALAGCATWDSMSGRQQGTAAGAAVGGALVGGELGE